MVRVLALCLVFAQIALAAVLRPDDPAISYLGRHHANSTLAQFDWVATGFQLQLQQSTLSECDPGAADNVTAVLAGHSNFAVLVGGQLITRFSTTSAAATYDIASAASVVAAGGTLTLLKITEPFFSEHAVSLFQITLPACVQPATDTQQTAESLRLDFYGDSDTAAYGVDGSSGHPLKCLEQLGEPFENFLHGWVWNLQAHISRQLDLRVQAVSGIGVVRNAVGLGTPTLSTKLMPQILHRTLQTAPFDDYAPNGWQPSLLVVYLGSNDYVNLFPPSNETFRAKYTAMVDSIVAQYPSPAPPVLHICGGESKPCDFVEDVARQTGGYYTTTFDEGEPKQGCIGHRGAAQQKALAARLANIIVNASDHSNK